MAENAGVKTSELLQRVRDPQGAVHSRAFTVDILSQCQRLVNAKTGLVTGSASLGLSGRQLFYSPLSTLLPEASAVTGVRYQGANLERTTPEELRALDSTWFRRIGFPEAYTVIGREILVISPAVEFNETVTVDYIKLTTDFVGEESSFELADQDTPSVLDLAEIILLTRWRKQAQIVPLVEQLTVQLALKEREHGI